MKRIGIVSCYNHPNYGSMLQAFATQEVIKKIGYEPITYKLDDLMNYSVHSKILYYIRRLTNISILREKIRRIISARIGRLDKEYQNGIITRKAAFDKFCQEKIELSELNKTRSDLTDLSKTMDAVVVGSDQLWHPRNLELDLYSLSFVPKGVKKISYATSIGTNKIPTYTKEEYRKFLMDFHSISVRENTAKNILDELQIQKKIEVVLDPTLLFSGNDWKDKFNIREDSKNEYIFCYFLGVNPRHREIANDISRKTGLKIVTLKNLDEYVLKDKEFGQLYPYDVGPVGFLNLINNAKYVLTDSFHGSVFSILFHKQFIVFDRFRKNNKESTNSRIFSLMNIVGLEKYYITDDKLNFEKVFNVIDKSIKYENVEKKIENERKKSINYLVNSFSDVKDAKND